MKKWMSMVGTAALICAMGTASVYAAEPVAEENMLMGTVTEINGDEVTLEIGGKGGRMKGMKQELADGETAEKPELPEGVEEGEKPEKPEGVEESEKPELPQGTEAGEMPARGGKGGMKGMKQELADGETTEKPELPEGMEEGEKPEKTEDMEKGERPELPEGAEAGEKPEMPEKETVVIDLGDITITMKDGEETAEISLDDLEVGVMLRVELDEDGSAVSADAMQQMQRMHGERTEKAVEATEE